MDQSLIKVGLPVTCSSCGEKGFVKPGSDYSGWYRRRLGHKSRWYCPADAISIKKLVESLEQKYRTPEPEQTPEDTTEALYKLLD